MHITTQIKRILKKLYRYENQYYNEQGERCYSEKILSEKEKILLSEYGWKVNDIVSFSGHDDVIAKLHNLKGNPLLSRKRCLDAFIAGIGGSYPRGLSVLPAWYYMELCPSHSYEEKPAYECCWICGEKDESRSVNNAEFQYCLYLGNAYSSQPMYAYLNLNHLINISPVEPTKDDITAFAALLDLFRAAPDDETPGRFEKRLTEAKIMKGDRNTKRGVLNSLALLGAVPNAFISLSEKSWSNFGDITICEKQLNNTKGRSDMEMPWAGWNGSLKLDEKRISELFGEYWNVFI